MPCTLSSPVPRFVRTNSSVEERGVSKSSQLCLDLSFVCAPSASISHIIHPRSVLSRHFYLIRPFKFKAPRQQTRPLNLLCPFARSGSAAPPAMPRSRSKAHASSLLSSESIPRRRSQSDRRQVLAACPGSTESVCPAIC